MGEVRYVPFATVIFKDGLSQGLADGSFEHLGDQGCNWRAL